MAIFFNAIINAVQDTTKAETPDRSIDIKVLENKVAAANYFVEQTATGDGNSSDFKTNAKNAIDGVTSDLTTIDASKLLTLVYAKTLKADEKNNLDGTWQAKDAMGEMNLVFNADGTFIASAYSDQLDPGEINGSEKGTYQWDSITGDLAITTVSDNNGTGGLSQPGIGSKTLNIKTNGDDLVVSVNQEIHTFTPVAATPIDSMIVGNWRVLENDNGGVTQVDLTFSSDSSYSWLQQSARLEPGEVDGLEQGYFSWDANTKLF